MVGMTLQTELNFTNVPYVLELARIPAWASERREEDPVVVGGGPEDGLIGVAGAATEGTVTARQLENRPLLRPDRYYGPQRHPH